MSKVFGKYGPAFPRLGKLAFAVARPLAKAWFAAHHVHTPDSRYARMQIAAMTEKLERGETVYLIGLCPSGHNSGVSLVEVSAANGIRLISNDEEREKYRELLGVVKEEYTDLVKNEVQKAIAADEGALKRLCANYIDNLRAYVLKEKVRNSFTGEYEEPNERLMRSIEEKIDIPEARKDDFRRELMNYIAALALDGKTFDYTMNERLHRALELKLFEDSKDSIKLTSLVSDTMDPDTQAKIEVVKKRLIDHYGYDEISATDVLNYVASIFARGDANKK